MDNQQSREIKFSSGLMSHYFLDAKSMFLYHFNHPPSVFFRNSIDGEKAYDKIKEQYKSSIVHTYTYRRHTSSIKPNEFDETIIIFSNGCLLEFDKEYCCMMHNGTQDAFLNEITALINQFKKRQRRKPREVNLVVSESGELTLKAMEIKRTKLDFDLYYEDDFKAVDQTIKKRLAQKDDKGIVLLHGLPGTGKTTYLRHLIGQLKKRVMFLSPNIAGDLTHPSFIDLLIDNPDSVIIIEDAENIIMDRRINNSSAVSNLLNISDGLLADFLNVQLICTFNSPLTMVDEALLRKGRLIAKYEFGKLSVDKSQRLSNHLGYHTVVCKPMTVAEITNQTEHEFQTRQKALIGFKRSFIADV
ncbi:AAA family ATPase [Taibaiella soli]|uniref:AAA family ATPase n=1 Tax=Taibaiella soli TaxID=1649169 RepID=A0A2W2B804_9BACT|nr:AAA family ATPase [Taibaiella soli]PZF72097.1 AAA family ATPase [Taibaiella soli]